MAETWDETKPAGSRNPIFGDDDIREFKRAMRERLAEDHEFESTESPAFGDANYKIGKHRYVTLLETSGDKTTLENEICLIAKNYEGHPELHIVSESGGSAALLTRNDAKRFNTLGFFNGSVNIAWPTNNMAAGSPKIMVGDSNTITWFYLNTAPPGWKVLSTGADMVLAISGGSAAYNVNGGNPDSVATWTISGLSAANEGSHTHNHNHKWYEENGATAHDDSYSSGGTATDLATAASKNSAYKHLICSQSTGDSPPTDMWTNNDATSGSSHGHSISQNAGWRPKASVGKLFQLDTA